MFIESFSLNYVEIYSRALFLISQFRIEQCILRQSKQRLEVVYRWKAHSIAVCIDYVRLCRTGVIRFPA